MTEIAFVIVAFVFGYLSHWWSERKRREEIATIARELQRQLHAMKHEGESMERELSPLLDELRDLVVPEETKP